MLRNFQTEDEYFKFEEGVETRNEVINDYLYIDLCIIPPPITSSPS
jgi:hypothetical protein